MEVTKEIEILKKQFNENINSHVFLVETNNLDKCLSDIKNIIKSKLNTQNQIVDDQIDNETYLEHIIIRPDGKEIKKDQILELQERIKTKPILSTEIFYTLIPAESLSEISSNKLLKTIEEPNDHITGFLITNNSDQILSTIKSRCEQVKFLYEPDIELTNAEIDIDIQQRLIMALEKQDHIDFTNILQDKNVKEYYKEIANLLKDYYNMACNLYQKEYLDKNIIQYLKNNNSYERLIKKSKILNKEQNKLSENMNNYLYLESIYLKFKE